MTTLILVGAALLLAGAARRRPLAPVPVKVRRERR